MIGDLINVDDGYIEPHAGFMVFEETLRDKEGNSTDERRILEQAYIWYDPVTRTICYDNIEIPKNLLEEMRKASKSGDQLSTNALLDTVVESADAVMTAMNRNGVPVERVTTAKATIICAKNSTIGLDLPKNTISLSIGDTQGIVTQMRRNMSSALMTRLLENIQPRSAIQLMISRQI